ncbi:MAG: DNA N-6-adenine-methyltransferase [Myxococcaceae bacterium]|nr:DNA N-6-adenine-methyltransferase [Myxococcaceae bacterium]
MERTGAGGDGALAALKESDQWETPQPLFDALDRQYRFKRDLFATQANAKARHFFTIDDNALAIDWHVAKWEDAGWDFANPPYSKPNLTRVMAKAREEVQRGWAGVLLVPATPGTAWFQDFVLRGHDVMASGGSNPAEPELEGYWFKMAGTGYQVKVTFLKGRVTFWRNGAPAKEATAKTDSCVIEWRPRRLL